MIQMMNKSIRHISRAFIAALIGLSVATLPATIGFSVGAPSAEISAAKVMPDCEHHHHKAPNGATKGTAHDNVCMATCAAACFGFTSTEFSGVAYLAPVSATLNPLRVSTAISSLTGSPPFRPPRV